MKRINGEIKNIFNMKELERLFRTYLDATGLSVTLYDAAGAEYLCVRSEHCICDFVSEKSVCLKKIAASSKKSAELKKPYIYETECGLIMCIAPVFVDDAVAGFIATGPVSLWEKEDFFEEDFVRRCKKVGVDIEKPGFDISAIKHVDCKTMSAFADLLMLVVDYMGEKERAFRTYRDEKEAKFKELVKEIDENSGTGNRSTEKYPIALEKELISFVQLGDKTNSRRILNNLLAEIFLFAGGDLDIIKAKLYELTAFLSRTAVEVGAKITDLADIVKKSSGLFIENTDFHDLCILTIEILDEYLAIVYKTRGHKPAHAHLVKVISIINDEYGDSSLNLTSVAKKVYVSPYYISHLFHDEMNTTFNDYLTGVRINHAKDFLLEGLSCEAAAEKSGFADASYFTKIFKKYMGITPARYRKAVR
ncbi:MAG: PocR ligand-binding domain-containing protein [Clostridia bacterium]|nr:PocR ligand-binding domain-containing protein [Clostridia bacterium]